MKQFSRKCHQMDPSPCISTKYGIHISGIKLKMLFCIEKSVFERNERIFFPSGVKTLTQTIPNFFSFENKIRHFVSDKNIDLFGW